MEIKSAFKIPKECFSVGTRKQFDALTKLQEKGLYLTSHGKVAIVLVLEDRDEYENSDHHTILEKNEKSNPLLMEAMSYDNGKFIEVGGRFILKHLFRF